MIGTPVTHSPVDPECRKAAANAARLCEQLGHHVEEIELPLDPRVFFAAYGPIMAAGLVERVSSRSANSGAR